MKVVAHETVEYEIWLTQEEAEWLKSVLQNPVKEIEESKEYEMRAAMFNLLKNKGV